jgi:hypothetical protein
MPKAGRSLLTFCWVMKDGTLRQEQFEFDVGDGHPTFSLIVRSVGAVVPFQDVAGLVFLNSQHVSPAALAEHLHQAAEAIRLHEGAAPATTPRPN